MKNSLLLNLVVLSFFTTSAWAGGGDWQDVGNGGDVVFCRSDEVTERDGYSYKGKFYSLDYIETTHRWGFLPDLPEDVMSSIELAQLILKRLPVDYNYLRGLAQLNILGFEAQSTFVDEELPDAMDEGFVLIPVECDLLQLVLQKKPARQNDYYYRIDKSIWDELDGQQRAIVMVHEALYGRSTKALEREYSSEKIRYLIALLISNAIENGKIEVQEFDRLMTEAGFWKE